MAELLGTHNYQLDPKGRISLPGRFREALADGAYLTLGQDGCLFCFPRAEWEDRSIEVRAAPLSDTEGRAYARMFFGNAEPVDLDAQGRLVVPQRLRQQVAIGKEVVVVGVQDRMEIWDREAHERYLDAFGGAYQAGTLYPAGPDSPRSALDERSARIEEKEEAWMNGPLVTEVRQSLTLLGSLALAVGVPLGLGLLTVRILG